MKKNSYFDMLRLLLPLIVAIESEMNYLPPPTNITATISSPFQIILAWEPIDANCTPVYQIVISSRENSTKSTKHTFYKLDIYANYLWLDFNYYFSADIWAKCDGMKSERVRKSHMQLAPGNKRTSVKHLICVWHYREFIECTWQPGEEVPPKVQYRLLYWEYTSMGTLPKSSQLQDLLQKGTECLDYFPSDGMYTGCKFSYKYTIETHKNLMFVVTDTSYSIKPFFYYTPANDIGKLPSPNITYVSKVTSDNLHIKWTMSPQYNSLIYEVLVSSDTGTAPFKANQCCSKNIAIPPSDGTMRVKIRVQFSVIVADSKFWSDWSKEYTFTGQGNNNTTSLLLLILIPAALMVIMVLLLVYLKRLKILLCPPIPHPGNMFQNDLQHWLNLERPTNVYGKPEQEDISPVSLIEV